MKRAFTLIEVTVALAIFGLAAVILSQSFLGGMLSLSSFKYDDKNIEFEEWVKREVFYKTKREDIQEGGKSELPDGREVIWESTIHEGYIAGLFKIKIHYTLIGEKTETSYADYILYRPEWVKTLSIEKQ